MRKQIPTNMDMTIRGIKDAIELFEKEFVKFKENEFILIFISIEYSVDATLIAITQKFSCGMFKNEIVFVVDRELSPYSWEIRKDGNVIYSVGA